MRKIRTLARDDKGRDTATIATHGGDKDGNAPLEITTRGSIMYH